MSYARRHSTNVCPGNRVRYTICCFGKVVKLDDEALRSHLSRLELQEGIAKYRRPPRVE